MGIKGLIPFLNEKVPGSISEMSLESLSGESIAVDASTALYQFTIAIRDSSYFNSLVNSSGESTSHIYGMMSRCSKLLECGIKPVFVFDSKPPDLKLRTLEKRKKRREEASSSLKQAIAEGDKESIKKLMGRTVKVTKEMNDSAKKLLRLMGVPVIEALEEAEAQCAYLVRNSLCRFVASEDTDTLAFGGGYLLRNVTASSNKKILKVDLQKALTGLELSFEQFVDFCILCGCDYCDTLEGVGPKTAYTLVKRYESLEEIVNMKGGNYEDFKEAKEYFMAPKVNDYDQASIKMGTLDAEALTDFLVNENNFAKERVDKFVEKLLKFKGKKVQTSLLSFLSAPQPSKASLKDSKKRSNPSKTVSSFKRGKSEFGSKNTTGSKTNLNTRPSLDNRGSDVDYENDQSTHNDKEDLFDNFAGKPDTQEEDSLNNSQKLDETDDKYEMDENDDLNVKDYKADEDYKVNDKKNEEVKTSVKNEKELSQHDSPFKSRHSDTKPQSDMLKAFKEENVELELKLFNTKRILFDDDEDDYDKLTTATSDNMNCEIDNVKKEEEKKGSRNLFDVLVPYPKPTKKTKT